MKYNMSDSILSTFEVEMKSDIVPFNQRHKIDHSWCKTLHIKVQINNSKVLNRNGRNIETIDACQLQKGGYFVFKIKQSKIHICKMLIS